MAAALCFFVAAVIISSASGQGLGPGNCLISRIDYVPCGFPPKANTRRPGINEYGIYVTRYRAGGAGYPVCRILKRNHQIRKIRTIGEVNQVFVFYSPGFTLDEKYGESQYVRYNIQCRGGRLAFFNITRIDLEGRTCTDDSNVMRCVDYVNVDRGGFGVTESCGNVTDESNMNEFIPGQVQIIFRTNVDNNFAGFEANVICFNRAEGDLEGCTRPPGTNMTDEGGQPGNAERRRKRDLENFHKQWQRRAAYIRRMRRQAQGGNNDRFRIREISVLHGMNVTYKDSKLDFIDSSSGRIISDMTFENIIILMTYDGNGDLDVFKREAVDEDSGVTIPLPGPGPMFIVGTYAYFQLFVIDPRGLVPSPEEMVVLANLTEAQLEFAREDESERLDPQFLDQPTFDPLDIGLFPFRKRRQATPAPDRSFSNEAVMVALQNENACNPVLRASANSIIETLQETDAGKAQLDMLRAELSSTAPPSVDETESPM